MRKQDLIISGIILVLIFSLFFVYILIPDHDRQIINELAKSIAMDIWNLITDITVFITIFLYGLITGIVMHILLHLLDDKVEYERKIQNWQRIVIGFLLALIFAGLYILVFHLFLSIPDTWLRSIATRTYFGWQPWSGEFDRSPVIWSMYTFITFLLGYFIIFPKLTDYIDNLHITRGVGNPG